MEQLPTPDVTSAIPTSVYNGPSPQPTLGQGSTTPSIAARPIYAPSSPGDAMPRPDSPETDSAKLYLEDPPWPSQQSIVDLTHKAGDPVEGIHYIDEAQHDGQPSISSSNLDAKFTSSQLEYMESLKSEYTTATLSKRPNITRNVANKFITDIGSDGRELTSDERVSIHAARPFSCLLPVLLLANPRLFNRTSVTGSLRRPARGSTTPSSPPLGQRAWFSTKPMSTRWPPLRE